MDSETVGGIVMTFLFGVIVSIAVYGCRFNREHDINKNKACYEQTKSNECWGVK